MTRRAWLQLALGAGWLTVSSLRSGLSWTGPGRSFSGHVRRTLAALAETILPDGPEFPGARGLVVVRLIEERTQHDAAWKRLYERGVFRLDAFSRRRTKRTFLALPAGERAEVLAEYWNSTTGTDAENFLNTVKIDALNELYTTKAALSRLGYRLRVTPGGKPSARNKTE